MSKICCLCVGGTVGLFSLLAQAETSLCSEVVPPATITQPGLYCLFKDYTLNLADGAAVTILASNVVLDFNGHRIGNGAAGTANNARGIKGYADNLQGYKNITIRNGTLIGFAVGINLNGTASGGHLVEDMLVDRSLYMGVVAVGSSNVVRRNRVIGTGQISTWNSFSAAITVAGEGNSVVDNDILNTKALRQAIGIDVSGNGSIVSGNRINGLASGPQFDEIGILAVGSAILSDNRVIDVTPATSGGTTFGIHAAAESVKMVGNVVSVVGTAYLGGTQVPGTNH